MVSDGVALVDFDLILAFFFCLAVGVFNMCCFRYNYWHVDFSVGKF